MKTIQGVLALAFALIAMNASGSLVSPGDFLEAAIFPGVSTNTPQGNPDSSGQGWYRRNLTTPLNYYDNGQMRWATAPVRPTGTSVTFSRVTTNATGTLEFYDSYAGAPGVAWVYTNAAYGKYVLSIDKLVTGTYARGEVVSRANSQEAWVSLSGVYLNLKTLNDVAFTNSLGSGGGIAFKMWNNINMVADTSATATGMRVTFLEYPTNSPAVSLSVDTATLNENPTLQVPPAAMVTARVSELSSRDTTIDLAFSGSAIEGVDYRATTNRVVIPAGMSFATITLAPVDDAVHEGDETIVVSIGSLENATPGEAVSVAATLIDDDVPLLKAGDVLRASVFFGGADDTSEGNPSVTGQGWYRQDLVTPLKAYFSGTTTSKWATALANVKGSYSHVTASDPNTLSLRDNYSGRIGMAWIYTNCVPGRYVLSCSAATGTGLWTEALVRSQADAEWTVLTPPSSKAFASGFAFTNWLERGGAFAVKRWRATTTASAGTGTFVGLQCELIETHPVMTLITLR